MGIAARTFLRDGAFHMDTVCRNVCRILQLDANRYSLQVVNGVEVRRYDNRINIVGADLAEIELEKYM